MKTRQHGFTLTEVLLVSTMFAVISLSVFNAFSNGFKLWARGQHVMVEGDMAILLERMAEDLRSIVTFNGIPFKGSSAELSFPAVIMGPTDENGVRADEKFADQVGAVRYMFDPGEKKIYRSQAFYGQALKSQWSSPVLVASSIEDVTFRYYFLQDKKVDIKTQADQQIPMGVLIDLQFITEGEVCHMRRFLVVPVGGGI